MSRLYTRLYALVLMVLLSVTSTWAKTLSEVINIAAPFGKFLIGNPDIAEITPIDDQSFYVWAKQNGRTSIQIFRANQVDILEKITLQVGPDLGAVRQTISNLAPEARVKVSFVNTSLQLQGTVPDTETEALLLSAIEGMTGVTPINALKITSAEQVQLKVRFVEVSRSLNGNLGVGVQLSGQNGDDRYNAQSFELSGFALGNLSLIDASINIDLALKALEEAGYANFLAEPTLTALSGKTADFLAGGEVPVTMNKDGGVTTEYKSYGIQLKFTATVDQNGEITLDLAPEVSQVDFGNMSNGQPSFTTRRASTTVKMRDGESLVIAGLYQNNDSRNKSTVPGLGKLPLMGGLVRNTESRSTSTEVMIVVTPSLSTQQTAEQLRLKRLENSQASTPTQLYQTGLLERTPYDFQDLLSGKHIRGDFGPMLRPNGRGILNGQP